MEAQGNHGSIRRHRSHSETLRAMSYSPKQRRLHNLLADVISELQNEADKIEQFSRRTVQIGWLMDVNSQPEVYASRRF
jgi:hypothetical protein